MKKLPQDKVELWNVITHGTGFVLSIIVSPFLISKASHSGIEHATIGCGIFGISLMLMYAASSLYHLQTSPRLKQQFKAVDHIAIYALIAGTYTPFLIFYVEAPEKYYYLLLMWGIALIGTFIKIFYAGRFKVVSTIIYLIMGWLIIFIGQPIFEQLSDKSMFWLITGGVAYSLGTIFYLSKKWKYHHVIWHIFVLAGSISHFLAVWYCL